MFRVLKSSFVLSLLVLGLCAGILFAIKYQVQVLNKERNEINSNIVKTKETIHVLKAEYAYLATPKRLKKLIDENLHLQTVKPDQIINFNYQPPKKITNAEVKQ